MNKPRAAVIGGGFGGLAAAIRLQVAGIHTVIYEKRDKLGGRAYVYRDRGFTFDAGPTVLTAPSAIKELFDLAGRPMEDYVKLRPVEPFYRLYWEDGTRFDYSNDEKKLTDQIRKLNPADVEGYQKFFKYSQAVFEAGYTELVHVPFLRVWDMIRVAPKLFRLSAYRSVYQMVAKFIKEPHLRQAFSFHSLLIGGNPFTAPSIYTLIHALERKEGVHFPVGGMQALVTALGKLFTDLGGEIRLNSEISEILADKKQVVGLESKAHGKEFFDLVVSNADVLHTYEKLLRHQPAAKPEAARLKKARQSMSLFVIYFGTKKRFTHLAHHNIIFGPRYRELLDDIFEKGVLAEDFSLYLHVPTMTDPSLAPRGGEAFYVLSPVPHLGKLNLDWKKEGPVYAEKILNYLEKHHLPGLKSSIVTQRIFTPLDFKEELNSPVGSAFSLEPTLTQSAYFRVKNKEPRLRGLYFVGAGTHPGAGIPGVVNSGKATANLIIRELEKEPQLVKNPKWVHA